MLELISWAGTPEAVSAAVQNGAVAVYASFSLHDASPYSLSSGDFARAAEFCRQRGVKIYAVIDYLPSDGDFDLAVKTARTACRHGADAIVVNDLGLARVLRHVVPDLPLFAGPLLNIHDAEGIRVAAVMGFKRVLVAKELTLDELSALRTAASVEIEIAVHGPTCPAYSGLCHLSKAEQKGDALRGHCGFACHSVAANGVKEDFPLHYKDTCLVAHLADIENAGVTAIRIEGRERRPEYIALVTDVYARALRSRSTPQESETEVICKIFSPGGITPAWTAKDNRTMVARPASPPDVSNQFFASVKKTYLNREYQHVPVWFYVKASIAEPIRISVGDDRGNLVEMTGAAPTLAFHQELTYSMIHTELLRTGGTPFFCDGVKCSLDKGIFLPHTEIGKLRDALLKELLIRRKTYPPRGEFDFDALSAVPNIKDVPALTISVSNTKQLSPELAATAPTVLYVPIWEIEKATEALAPFTKTEGASICAVLPRVIRAEDREAIEAMLQNIRVLGVSEVMVSNFSHIFLARSHGFKVRCDYSLNVTNSRTAEILKELGVTGITLPFVMSPAEAKLLSKSVPAEMIVYGRLPLMYTENCISKDATGVCSCDNFSGLADSDGLMMPVIKEYGCRNILLSSRRLFLAGNMREYMNSGLSSVRLSFTTESAAECALIANRYLGLNKHSPVNIMKNSYGG